MFFFSWFSRDAERKAFSTLAKSPESKLSGPSSRDKEPRSSSLLSHIFSNRKYINNKESNITNHNLKDSTVESNKILNLEKFLEKVEYKDTKPFFHDIRYCKCVKVYDGDTITIATILNNNTNAIYRFSVRIMGVDTPEIKASNENEKRNAIIARTALYNKIYGKILRIEIIETPEKFGRILAKVYLNDENIADWLIYNGYGVPYYGKTKIHPDAWSV